MQYVYHGIKYFLRLILACILILVVVGIIQYRFNVSAYADYLNTRNIDDVSIQNPSSLVRLFVPEKKKKSTSIEDLLQEEEENNKSTGSSTGIGVEQDFMDFFGDFSQQDVSASISGSDDFGFLDSDTAAQTGTITSGELTPEEQRLLLIERLKQREARLEQEAMLGTGE